ncbi:MAG TPA: hypothetical protein DF712_23230 [Balneola sp.]|nr:hypothetical protein [Balneola sp.]|tara:strand:- start:210 stop:653 length:444 start_codon:yes stop_codon:yes gene_type:complete
MTTSTVDYNLINNFNSKETSSNRPLVSVQDGKPILTYDDGICEMSIDASKLIPSCRNGIWGVNYRPTGTKQVGTAGFKSTVPNHRMEQITPEMEANGTQPSFGLCISMFWKNIPEETAHRLCEIHGIDPAEVSYTTEQAPRQDSRFG